MNEAKQNRPDGNGMAPGATVASAVIRESEALARVQGEVLSGLEGLWGQWLQRRREAMEAASQALQKMCGCRSPVELAHVQQEWLCGAMQRSAADIGSFAAASAELTGKVGGLGATSAARGDDMLRASRPERAAAEAMRPLQEAAAE